MVNGALEVFNLLKFFDPIVINEEIFYPMNLLDATQNNKIIDIIHKWEKNEAQTDDFI